ncbi:GAF domain-containing protein [Anaeromyxobacter sp. SG26]|uniref:GAF domain-containing protein n=1 Tax=Anaeromyxobacter sp. SG26 TaxID=2925407 RepID=UPI001F56A7DC|nr:GAF domain-containing protein [Anaeromyxobacter sp. SG26]
MVPRSPSNSSDSLAQRLARYEELHALGVALAGAITREDVAAIVLERGLALVGARAVSLFLEREPEVLELVASVGLSERFRDRYRRVGPDATVPQVDAFRTGAPVWLRDPAEIAARYPAAADLAAEEGDRAWASVPLVLDRRRGAIGLRFSRPRAFDADERALIEAVTQQCAQALDRARLYDVQRQLTERITRLQRATSELSAAVTPEEVAAIALRELIAMGARGGAVLHRGAAGDLELVLAQGVAGAALARVAAPPPEDAPRWIAGREAISAASPALGAALDPAGEPWAAVPLRVEGRDAGVVVLGLDVARPLGEDARNDALALIQQCAQALERARVFDAQRRLAGRLARVQSTASALSGAATATDVAEIAAGSMAAIGAAGAELHALDRADRLTHVPRGGAARTVFPIDAPTLAAEVVRTGRAVWLSSRAELEARFPAEAADPAREAQGAWAAVPLLASGETLGALTVPFPEERAIDDDDRAFVRLVASPCAEALARARLYEAVARSRLETEWSAGVLDALFGAAPVALALFDREMRYTRVNARLEAMNGVPAAAHLGRTPLQVLPGLPGEQLAVRFRTVLETGRSIESVTLGETPAAPGTSRRWRESWFPVRVGGAIVGVGVLVVEEPLRAG